MAILGGHLWSPPAIAIIGGLLYSTFFTLLMVPCLYYAVMQKQKEKQSALQKNLHIFRIPAPSRWKGKRNHKEKVESMKYVVADVLCGTVPGRVAGREGVFRPGQRFARRAVVVIFAWREGVR